MSLRVTFSRGKNNQTTMRKTIQIQREDKIPAKVGGVSKKLEFEKKKQAK